MSSPPGRYLLPYRDVNNQTVNYVHAPGSTGPVPPYSYPHYDSDFEPLIASGSSDLAGEEPELDEDSIMHFTATGRPMPHFQHSGLAALAARGSYTLPQLLPKRYTDDSIIPAIVVDVIPSPKAAEEKEQKKTTMRRGSFLKKLKGERKQEAAGKGLVKVVYMPRRDYLKWFARGLGGEYIGTEPYRKWTEDELEEAFKQFKPAPVVKRGYRPFY